jgi:hypothetical protein
MKLLIVLAAIVCAASAQVKDFTAEETALVTKSWDTVKHNEVDILYAIFKAYPDIQARFPKFVGKDLETVKDTADFALHAGRIINFFSELVALGNAGRSARPAGLTLINELGHDHRNRGISKEQFNEFRTALTDYVSTHAPWGDNVAALWKQGLDNMYVVIFSNLDGKPVTSLPELGI